MSRSTTLSGKAGSAASSTLRLASLSKPELSRLVLNGTAAVISTVLLVWLIVSRMLAAPSRPAAVLADALTPPETLSQAGLFASRDARLISKGAVPRATAETGLARFERVLKEYLGRKTGQPAIIYLSAVGATWSDDRGTHAYLLASGDSLANELVQIPIEDVLRLLRETGKSTPKLLILDADQVSSERELGVFGDGLVARLKELVGDDSRLAVLTSCAPGQKSWTDETAGHSVFAYYVAQALDGQAGSFGSLTVSQLHDYVAPRVAQWVRQNRGGAIQTPMLLGQRNLRVWLPRSRGRNGETRTADLAKTAKAVREAIQAEWLERQKLDQASPHPRRHASTPWRHYQWSLLGAERFARTGDWAAASRALKEAERFRGEVNNQRLGLPLSRPQSLAMARSVHVAGSLPVDPDTFEAVIPRLIQNADRKESPSPSRDEPAKPEPSPTEPAKAEPAKDEPAKAKAKSNGNGQAKSQKAPAPAAPAEAAPAADPLDVVTGGAAASGVPLFVEGQVPVWYATFARLGGESSNLKDLRIALVDQAFRVRKLAEQAVARDERVLSWIRPLVEQGDQVRREAQDRLFAAEKTTLDGCKKSFNDAEDLYRRALALAVACAEDLELLDELQEKLPYYGDWMARRRNGVESEFLALLESAAGLAELVLADPAKDPSLLESRRKLSDTLRTRFQKFEDNFQQIAERAVTIDDWREVDALLYVPMIAPATRQKLFDHVGDEALSPSLASESGDLGEMPEPEFDPAFWNQAIGLAQIEAGLLKTAGQDVTALEQQIDRARSDWKNNAATALERMSEVSGMIQRYRSRLLDLARDRSGSPGAWDEQVLAADRAARILPAVDLRRLANDPVRRRDEQERRAWIVWQARRLCDDLATREARSLLGEAALTSGDDLRAVLDLANARAAARLEIASQGPDLAQVRIERQGDLPGGLAAVFLAHDPSSPLEMTIRAPDVAGNVGSPSLIQVPSDKPATLGFDVVNRGVDLDLKPVAFYRGQFFMAPQGAVLPAADLVTVEIKQRYTTADILLNNRRIGKVSFPDQFEIHPNRGYLHPVNSLDYKLKITNTSHQKLQLFVSHGLDGLPPDSARLTLDGGESSEAVVGNVLPHDFPDEKTVRMLKIRITENDRNGRALCKDVEIPFQKVNPEPYIRPLVWFEGGRIHIRVAHLRDDPVTSPAEVFVQIEPFDAILQVDRSSHLVPLGESREYVYQILKPVESLTWTVNAEGVLGLIKQTVVINQLPKGPKPEPGAPAGAPGGAAPPPQF